MTTIVNLVAKLSADTTGFKSAIGELPSVLGAAKAGIAGLVSGIGLGAIAKASLDSADAINDLKERTGLAAETLSGLEQGLRMSGTSVDVLSQGVQRLAKNAELAAQGNKAMSAQFEALNLNATEFAALGADEQLRVYVEALSGVSDRGKQVLSITKLMGGAAKDLLPAFRDGAAGLDAMIATAEKSNRVLSKDQVEAAAAANDAIDLLNDSFSGLIRNLALNFAPAITAVANGLSSIVEVVGPAVKSFTEGFLQVGTSIGGIAAMVAQLGQGNFAGARELLNIERGDLAPTSRAGAARPADDAAKETAKNTDAQLKKTDELIRAVRGGVPAVAQ